MFLIIVNVLGHPKGVGGLTSYFLCGGGMDVFWNDPICSCFFQDVLVETIRIKIFGLAFWLCFDNWLANVKMLPSTILSWVQLSCDYRKCSYLNFRVIAIETSIAITL